MRYGVTRFLVLFNYSSRNMIYVLENDRIPNVNNQLRQFPWLHQGQGICLCQTKLIRAQSKKTKNPGAEIAKSLRKKYSKDFPLWVDERSQQCAQFLNQACENVFASHWHSFVTACIYNMHWSLLWNMAIYFTVFATLFNTWTVFTVRS